MGKAATTAVIAVIFSSLMFGEDLTAFHILGIALVILSVILINVKLRLDYIKRYGKYVSPLVKFGMVPLKVLIQKHN